jgi:translation initiation factor 4G
LEQVVESLVESNDVQSAAKTILDMKPPKKFVPELISYLILETMDKTDDNREAVSSLICQLKQSSLVNNSNYLEALKSMFDRLPSMEVDNPLVKSLMSRHVAVAVTHDIISLTDVAQLLEDGALYPLFLLCLQQLVSITDDTNQLTRIFHENQLNLMNKLPELDRQKGRMMQILDDRGLSFLFPLLRVEIDLMKQINVDPDPQSIHQWLCDHVDSRLYTDTGFIHILVTAIISHVTTETTMKQGIDLTISPEKSLCEQEKELLDKYKEILQKYLVDKSSLQLTAIYALQTFAHEHNSPKGLLLRWFINMYDMEIIDEDAFLKWKEEVNDVHPGKGQALFQVNHWLTWLEQAEEEESEDEDH